MPRIGSWASRPQVSCLTSAPLAQVVVLLVSRLLLVCRRDAGVRPVCALEVQRYVCNARLRKPKLTEHG